MQRERECVVYRTMCISAVRDQYAIRDWRQIDWLTLLKLDIDLHCHVRYLVSMNGSINQYLIYVRHKAVTTEACIYSLYMATFCQHIKLQSVIFVDEQFLAQKSVVTVQWVIQVYRVDQKTAHGVSGNNFVNSQYFFIIFGTRGKSVGNLKVDGA